MKSRNKFFAVSGIMAGAGLLLYAVGFGMGGTVTGVSMGSNGLQVHTSKGIAKDQEEHYQEGKESMEKFESIEVTLDYTDFKVEVSDHYGIEYRVNADDNFSFQVKDGCLEVVQGYKKGETQFNLINFGFNDLWTASYEKQYVTIYVPENTALEDMSVINDSGNMSFGGFNAEQLTVEADYGNVEIKDMKSTDADFRLDSGNVSLKNIKTKTLNIKDEYGNCELEQVSVKEQARIEMDSGNITMEDTDIKGLDISAEYGDIDGKNVQLEEVFLKLDSGDCELEELTINKAEIEAEYGNVILGLTDRTSEYGMELYTDYGDITLDDGNIGEKYNRKEGEKTGKQLKINCDSGNIEISGK